MREVMSELSGSIFAVDPVLSPRDGPLYLQLKRWIEDAVQTGAVRPGDALPSERRSAFGA
jgi:GntR family transcriptional regulator